VWTFIDVAAFSSQQGWRQPPASLPQLTFLLPPFDKPPCLHLLPRRRLRSPDSFYILLHHSSCSPHPMYRTRPSSSPRARTSLPNRYRGSLGFHAMGLGWEGERRMDREGRGRYQGRLGEGCVRRSVGWGECGCCYGREPSLASIFKR
jgi:hypothetical protein